MHNDTLTVVKKTAEIPHSVGPSEKKILMMSQIKQVPKCRY